MKKHVWDVSRETFWQLVVIYALAVVVVSLGVVSRFTLHFEIFALILGVLGIGLLGGSLGMGRLNIKWKYVLIVLGVFLIVLFRVIPYIGNDVPIGYDSGIYKYAIENGLSGDDEWVARAVEPGFLYLMEPLKLIFSTDFILSWGFIGFNLILGASIYFFSKEYFNERVGVIAFLIYSVSVIQFEVFTYMYYKNIIGLSLMLFSFYFLRRYNKDRLKRDLVLFVILGGFLGGVHRPTFYIYGLSYFVYAFVGPYTNRNYDKKRLGLNVISGIIILLIAGSFYLGRFSPSVTGMFNPVLEGFVDTGSSPGTFLSFKSYQFLTLAYLPFALLGAFYLFKKKEYNVLMFWVLINAGIVYFQFFFFNRFIIHLDIALIILSGVGFSLLIDKKKKFGIILVALMLFSAGFVSLDRARELKPLINENGLELIKSLENVDGKVMSLTSEYSPWVLGYSGKDVIAPGLFDENSWNESEWEIFWNSDNKDEIRELMGDYQGEIYLFSGTREFNNPCFELFRENGKYKVLKYGC